MALIFFLLLTLLHLVSPKLVHVMQITRHGNTASFANIPSLDTLLPNGISYLTPTGQRQMYMLGLSMRKRYLDTMP